MQADKSGPILRELLNAHERFTVLETAIVPDVLEDIRAQVQAWSSKSQVHLVLTTGGTGFAPNDVTPEVCSVPSARLFSLSHELGSRALASPTGSWSDPSDAIFIPQNHTYGSASTTCRRYDCKPLHSRYFTWKSEGCKGEPRSHPACTPTRSEAR